MCRSTHRAVHLSFCQSFRLLRIETVMDVNLACVYLFLVFSSVEQCSGRRGLGSLLGSSLPQQSKPAPAVPVVCNISLLKRNVL